MRWLPFFILAYVALGVQSGLSGYDQVDRLYHARPNLVLLSALFVAVHAQRDAALLAAFILGLMQDLLTDSPLGLNAFAYGAIAAIIVNVQEMVYRDHVLTHVSLGLVGGLIYAAIVYLHGLIYHWAHTGRSSSWSRPSLLPLLAGAVYTAALAPVVLYVLQRFRRVFGFRAVRMMHGMRR
jgi:rod shape-determining protein MreD